MKRSNKQHDFTMVRISAFAVQNLAKNGKQWVVSAAEKTRELAICADADSAVALMERIKTQVKGRKWRVKEIMIAVTIT